MKTILLVFISLIIYSCSSTDNTKQECRIKLTKAIENQNYKQRGNIKPSSRNRL